MTEEEGRLLALLESQHDFPGPYTIKVIFPSEPALSEAILAAVATETGIAVPSQEPSMRSSSGGKFLSMSVTFDLSQAEEVLAIYRVLGSLENVVSYF